MKSSSGKFNFVAGASSGGELDELLVLLELSTNEWPIYPNCFVTTNTHGKVELEKLSYPTFLLESVTRKQPLRILKLLYKSFLLATKLKPNVFLTTGSLPLAVLAFWSFIFGSSIIWIECSASLASISWSGKFVAMFASRFYVQHPALADQGKIYCGELA